jgi:isoquinoline 1-oxidoreductase subunit beta
MNIQDAREVVFTGLPLRTAGAAPPGCATSTPAAHQPAHTEVDQNHLPRQRHLPAIRPTSEVGGPVLFWRSVGSTHTAFSTETFLDELAQVAEVSLGRDGLPKVERVVCAVDCGVAVNLDVIRAQMEGGIGNGLAGALWTEITLVHGRVQQSNSDTYRPLRIEEMPQVEVYIVQSAGPPTIALAVANALFHLTGRRVRRLPLARLIA